MQDVLLAILVPILNALVTIIFWAFWIAAFVYAYTVGGFYFLYFSLITFKTRKLQI